MAALFHPIQHSQIWRSSESISSSIGLLSLHQPTNKHSKSCHKPHVFLLQITSSISPPSSKQEAILQAKTCLSTALSKPLNNPNLSGKLKKLKQPRYRIEIPVADDDSSHLALHVFEGIPIKKKNSVAKILILYPNANAKEAANKAFMSSSSSSPVVDHLYVSSTSDWDSRSFSSVDIAVFFEPQASNLNVMKTVADSLYPKPVTMFNPRWAYEEESSFGELRGFLDSFEVLYSFTGLEVKGMLSRRKGAIFKCLENGVLGGGKWNVLIEQGGDMKVVSRFKTRPSVVEVENVLYNAMAIDSPVTKSVQFLRDLVSNFAAKK